MFGSEKFGGIKITSKEIQHKDGSGPIAGAHAIVDTAGEIDKRFTATRLLLTGPFALAWRKKKDKRELYIAVEGDGFAFVEEVDPKKGAEARKFAAKINSLSAKASKAAPAVEPDEATPPVPQVTPDLADQLTKLATLRDQGILSDEEFAAQKAKLLG